MDQLVSVPGYGTPAGTLSDLVILVVETRVNAAEGGIMETEEASEMIDMGGQEKDYRDEGGFVAMGGEERADDVPARLSKNEFVFTADAVRNAGGGDIDRGSEVMQNLMDNLEQGGQVSEDSQGLGGGEEMMSEEIIEEPNGAQAMYEQQQAITIKDGIMAISEFLEPADKRLRNTGEGHLLVHQLIHQIVLPVDNLLLDMDPTPNTDASSKIAITRCWFLCNHIYKQHRLHKHKGPGL